MQQEFSWRHKPNYWLGQRRRWFDPDICQESDNKKNSQGQQIWTKRGKTRRISIICTLALPAITNWNFKWWGAREVDDTTRTTGFFGNGFVRLIWQKIVFSVKIVHLFVWTVHYECWNFRFSTCSVKCKYSYSLFEG